MGKTILELKVKKGFGWYDKQRKAISMTRCFECGRENYAPAVTTGECAWCGYDANGLVPEFLKGKKQEK